MFLQYVAAHLYRRDSITMQVIAITGFGARVITMRSSLSKAVKLASRTAKNLVAARELSCSSKKQWNDSFFSGPPPWGNGSSWGLQRFLEEVGTDGREARFWLKVFQHRDANPEQPFAVLQVSSSVFKRPDMLTKLGSSLAFLQRNGLTCILVHGTTNGSEDERSKLAEQAMQLADALEGQGARTRPFVNCSGVFKANESGTDSGFSLDTKIIRWSLSSGFIPIVSSLVETNEGGIINVCPTKATDELAAHFEPLKVMYLNSKGGLTTEKGRVIEVINLPYDLESSSHLPWCDRKTKLRMANINSLLEKLPFTSSVVITSADTVLNELFTHKGSGTIFKKRELLNVHKDFSTIDADRLFNLIEGTFTKKLTESYLEKVKSKLLAAYITESYSAAAIITTEDELHDIPYLDKFAVSLQNQGLGSGETIWERMRQDFPTLFWRSKSANRINPWYFIRSEGSWTNSRYTVFWYGISQPSISNEIVNFAVSHPTSFVEDQFYNQSSDFDDGAGKHLGSSM